MKIEWNKVTWYSKIIALAMYIILPFAGFYFGMNYQKNLDIGKQASLLKTYQNPCKTGEVALFEGGLFSSCQKPSTSQNINSPTTYEVTKPTATGISKPTISETNKPTTTKNFTNNCPDEEVALYEGGVFSGCAKPSQ